MTPHDSDDDADLLSYMDDVEVSPRIPTQVLFYPRSYEGYVELITP